MNPERHEEIEKIFSEIVEAPKEDHAHLLDRACGHDSTLRREVEELLAADATQVEPFSPWSALSSDLVEGTGTYRILSEIGRGGMGVVYLAERSDGAFKRRVAIKVLQRHSSREGDLQKRFRTERQILATLDHPYIARLLDGGSLSDGSPFLVMEYVEGEPIDRFADKNGLSVEARLKLFLAVSDAVQAAHQSLVVHRDLKPSNVLVTAEGSPKLLDFGIAKLLDPQTADWTLAHTGVGGQPLTPRYASPEQLRNEPITTATDVYALGVLLYELLTGRPPYKPQSSAAHHWVEAVCEHDPRRPSTVVNRDQTDEDTVSTFSEPKELRRRLMGDLDNIVLKALHKDPRRRYATAADLARDLQRHLDGLPIVAGPASLRYRTQKFLLRHRLGAAVVLGLLLLAASFTIGLQQQLRRTEIERDKARTVADFLVNVFGIAEPSTVENGELTAREILDRGFEEVRQGLEDQPQIKSTLLDVIGRVYSNLGLLEDAGEAHEMALELRQDRRKAAPLEYAESLAHLALVYLNRSDLDRAEAMYREALAITAEEAGEEDPRTIARLDGLLQVLSKQGRHVEAEAVAQRVVAATLRRLGFANAKAAVASNPSGPDYIPIATTLGSLAAEQRQLGHYTEAVETLGQALALNRRLLGEGHYGVAFNLNNLANVYSSLEKVHQALETRQEALEIAEPVFGPDHPSVASMHLNQGFDLSRVQRFGEASEEVHRARVVFESELGPKHPAVAIALSYDGLAKIGLGQLEEALAAENAALELGQQVMDKDHPDLTQIRVALAEALEALDRKAEALGIFREAAESYERALGPKHPQTLICRSRQAEALLEGRHFAAAVEILEPTVSALSDRGDLPLPLARAQFRLARALSEEQPPSEAARRLGEKAKATFDREGEMAWADEVSQWLKGSRPTFRGH